MEKYKITIAGLNRELPICKINDNLSIAALIMFNDVELTVAASGELLKKCPDFDIILTPEAKSIPLAYEMARQSGKPYLVARKGKKLYMHDPFSVSVKSITTDSEQQLWLDSNEGELMRGKKVLIVDDVISTGNSLNAVIELAKQFGAEIAASACVLAEGDAANRTDIIFLEPLPLFEN